MTAASGRRVLRKKGREILAVNGPDLGSPAPKRRTVRKKVQEISTLEELDLSPAPKRRILRNQLKTWEAKLSEEEEKHTEKRKVCEDDSDSGAVKG